MNDNKKNLVAIFLGIFGAGLCQIAFSMFSSAPAVANKTIVVAANNSSDVSGGLSSANSSQRNASEKKQSPLYCPQPQDLIKTGTTWTADNGKWTNHTPSSATKVIKFTGAQWVGIKIGKVICLYQTNEAVAFPLALEQKLSSLILEPKNVAGWSALVGNRRFCKSVSVADCPYYVQKLADISNIYKQIQYAPRVNVLKSSF